MDIKVASAYIANDAGDVLLLQRSAYNTHFVGSWQLPEGKIKDNESPKEALCREVFEELSQRVLSMLYVGRVNTVTTIKGRVIHVERAIFHVVINMEGGGMKLSNEHDQYMWVAPDSITRLNAYPGTSQVVSFIRRNNG